MLLAGDIGGTKTVLALISTAKGVRQPVRAVTYSSDNYDSLETIISTFLHDVDTDRVTRASFGVAGPVIDEQAEITNLPWIIDADAIGRRFDIRAVHLLNDLEAIAEAIPHLGGDDLATLNTGTLDPHGAIAVIAPGTGLGEAFLIWDGHRYQAHPSEGGHASFAPNTVEQGKLLAFLQESYGHVSCERVCSGDGIPNIYGYLRDSGKFSEPDWLRQELTSAEDPTPIISMAAETQRAEICVATMNLFVEILAGEASNLALKVLATGGVFLGGGIPRRVLSQLKQPFFMEIFSQKGRLTDLMASLPVRVILHPRAALHGAAYYALQNTQHDASRA
jgi:glucokinase